MYNVTYWLPRLVAIATISLLATGCAQLAKAPAEPTARPAVVGKFNPQGEWEYEELGQSLILVLDEDGNGNYSWKNGRIITTEINGRTWRGRWLQPGNDREGKFELQLTDDYRSASGNWWYTRIGDNNAPSRKGGRFRMYRLE